MRMRWECMQEGMRHESETEVLSVCDWSYDKITLWSHGETAALTGQRSTSVSWAWPSNDCTVLDSLFNCIRRASVRRAASCSPVDMQQSRHAVMPTSWRCSATAAAVITLCITVRCSTYCTISPNRWSRRLFMTRQIIKPANLVCHWAKFVAADR